MGELMGLLLLSIVCTAIGGIIYITKR
ncbi:MAG: QVPTGV class sortase B protein-sorting domain-containing protein [Lachnospiraceae bacterium]|nr:QVPTGV class sortase B protein-sorting domain-containing protein [Lachnospiraceae bacterium]